MLTRRRFLQIAFSGGPLALMPPPAGGQRQPLVGQRSGPMMGPSTMGTGGMGGGTASPAATPFQSSLPIPPVLSPTVRTDAEGAYDYYEISVRTATASILPGLSTPIWGFNGLFPGPTIKARSGRRSVVRQINRLPEKISVHLHGGHIPPAVDGHPRDLIDSGAFKDYVFPNNQPAATLWYHDHADKATGPHIYKGLVGMYVIEDDSTDGLPLPKGNYDLPLFIQDRSFSADGSFNYGMNLMSAMQGVLGDVVLVNGAIQPRFWVANRKYRFRLVNASNARQ